MELIDTHCHIHEIGLGLAGHQSVARKWADGGISDPDEVMGDALRAGVSRMICVGTTPEDSEIAVNFSQDRANCYASIGIHPHEAKQYVDQTIKLRNFRNLIVKKPRDRKIVAVGECGLDYYYEHSPKEDQKKLLRLQIDLALEHELPLIFHVRDAFDDFWPIFDSYKGIRGVLHSFTATKFVLEQALSRGLYIGLNGIMTFTKDGGQLEAAKLVPKENLLLETDAPFLTPAPFRGTICRPEHVSVTAAFLAELRGENLGALAQQTTHNARELFKL